MNLVSAVGRVWILYVLVGCGSSELSATNDAGPRRDASRDSQVPSDTGLDASVELEDAEVDVDGSLLLPDATSDAALVSDASPEEDASSPDSGATGFEDGGAALDAGSTDSRDAGMSLLDASGDAGAVDAGSDAGATMPYDGVACGAERCVGEQTCCLEFVGEPHCIAASGSCGGVRASCDGTEDCSGGDVCCASGTTYTSECRATCGGSSQVLCNDDADCEDGVCCPLEISGFTIQRCASSCR